MGARSPREELSGSFPGGKEVRIRTLPDVARVLLKGFVAHELLHSGCTVELLVHMFALHVAS